MPLYFILDERLGSECFISESSFTPEIVVDNLLLRFVIN
jgi:hypothetical protein